MGDVSVIGRRLPDGTIQSGWSGNGGYFKVVGFRLLKDYNDPKMVDYLFSLGQLSFLWTPHSEETTEFLRTTPIGRSHYIDPSERYLFSHIAFVDYGYFYDLDNCWYSVWPGPFRLKIPLYMLWLNLDESGFEYDFIRNVYYTVFEHIYQLYLTDNEFRQYLKEKDYSAEKMERMVKAIKESEYYYNVITDQYWAVWKYFDDWVVIQPAADGKSIGNIIMRPMAEKHIETINW